MLYLIDKLLSLIERFLRWYVKSTKEEMYLEGYKAGSKFMRENKNMDVFWAHQHSLRYDSFDRGWDDGVRFVLSQKETNE